jgi:hypothetical protein
LIFPQFSPAIDINDDRLHQIADHMFELMKKSKVSVKLLEFEAKIGRIEFRNSNVEWIKQLAQKPTWDILMPSNSLKPHGGYTFAPGLHVGNYGQREIFAGMLERLQV